MKAMKSMNMNRVLGSIKRKPGASQELNSGDSTLEENAVRNLKLFCESNNLDSSTGDEVLYLPIVVDACESSPSAAKEAAYVIRKFLSRENYNRPSVQYNSIMLIRILSQNPGPTFTRNMDMKFVHAVKELLRTGRDPNVRQLLVDTLDTLKRDKQDDEGLDLLIQMWTKEQEKVIRWQAHVNGYPILNNPDPAHIPQNNPDPAHIPQNNPQSRRLPNANELAMRIEEARSSSTLLVQIVQSAPSSALLTDELAQEMAQRCYASSNSMQAYIAADDPPPDNDTMERLIETNEMLSKAISAHQRAILKARKAASLKDDEASSINGNPFSDTQTERNWNSLVAQNGFLTRVGQTGSRPGYKEDIGSDYEDSNKSRSQPSYRY